MWLADLHVHSRFAYACARDTDLVRLAVAARRKGLAVVGTGDTTHPAWRAELREGLVEAEPGLWALRPELARVVEAETAGVGGALPRFVLQGEVSTVFRRGTRVHKVHHLVFHPDFAALERFVSTLPGRLDADGRPTLGLDARDLLELVLQCSADAHLIPAHVWTPWFAVLGARGGFDSVDEAYGDLAPHVFALETGLSSDPPMNWRVSALDRFRLVSNSDAHSPGKLGREATRFDGERSYPALFHALRTGEGYAGTLEFFPEEGKYHLDGHERCGVCLRPEESRARGDRCPTCGKPLTIGVLHRVTDLADRPEGAPPPPTGAPCVSLVPLPELVGELLGQGPATKAVDRLITHLVREVAPELPLLAESAPEEAGRSAAEVVGREKGERLAEGLRRLRAGQVEIEPGYDGAYGRVRVLGEPAPG